MTKRPVLLQTVVLVLGLLTFGHKALAHIEFNAFYTSDALTNDGSSTSSKMFIEGTAGFEIDKKGKYLVGWNYSMFTTSDATTSTIAYSSTQMGPRFLIMLDKDKKWSVGLAYLLQAQATFDSGGGTPEKWKGTGIKFDLGYQLPINERFRIGLRFNYSTTSYVEKLVNETTYSTIAYTRAMMYPSIYTVVLF